MPLSSRFFQFLSSSHLFKNTAAPGAMKRMQRVQSSPAIIAAACNLRQFSMHRRYDVEEKKTPEETNMVELLIDLKGGNGHWKQCRAKEKYAQEMKAQEERNRKNRLLEARRRNAEAKEAERQRKLQEEERRRNMEIAERERRQREEELAAIRAKKEQEEHNRVCRAQLSELKKPRPCNICKGSGKCIACGGKGYFAAMYLSGSVATGRTHDSFHGKTRRGCAECGGCKKDEDEGNVHVPLTAASLCNNPITGSGLCSPCNGTGKTKLARADISGADASWLQDIQALMRQMISSELGELLADTNWVIQMVAAEVLQEQGKAGGNAHKLAQNLRNKHGKVRAAAAASIGTGGTASAPYMLDLRALLQDPVQEVRKAAVKSYGAVAITLSQNQQANAVGELTQLQYDKDDEIAAIAKDALQKIKEYKESL